jgi:hypothetical protein
LHKIGVLPEETDSPRGEFGRGSGPPLPVGPAGRAPRLRRPCKRGSLPRERSVAAACTPKFRDAEYGPGRWRKLKGVATIRLATGRVRLAELHWYESHGRGRKEIKRKRYLD